MCDIRKVVFNFLSLKKQKELYDFLPTELKLVVNEKCRQVQDLFPEHILKQFGGVGNFLDFPFLRVDKAYFDFLDTLIETLQWNEPTICVESDGKLSVVVINKGLTADVTQKQDFLCDNLWVNYKHYYKTRFYG